MWHLQYYVRPSRRLWLIVCISLAVVAVAGAALAARDMNGIVHHAGPLLVDRGDTRNVIDGEYTRSVVNYLVIANFNLSPMVMVMAIVIVRAAHCRSDPRRNSRRESEGINTRGAQRFTRRQPDVRLCGLPAAEFHNVLIPPRVLITLSSGGAAAALLHYTRQIRGIAWCAYGRGLR